MQGWCLNANIESTFTFYNQKDKGCIEWDILTANQGETFVISTLNLDG
jgi:hypothetical protein